MSEQDSTATLVDEGEHTEPIEQQLADLTGAVDAAEQAGTEQAGAEQAGTEQTTPEQAPGQTAEATPAGPTEEEIKAAVDAFNQLVDEAITGDAEGERHPETGHLSDALKEKLRLAYGNLPSGLTKTSARPRAKQHVEELLAVAMDNADMPGARSLYSIQTECLVARGNQGGGLTKPPADPTGDFVNTQTAFWLVPYLTPVPEGVSDDWAARVDKLGRELLEPARAYGIWYDGDEDKRGDEPEVSDVVKAAVKLSRGRPARVARPRKSGDGTTTVSTRPAYAGPKRSVAKHIEEAFMGKPSGTFMTIGEIAKFKSNEYGDDKVSQGAVSARINADGGCTVPGIKAANGPDGKRGAVKV